MSLQYSTPNDEDVSFTSKSSAKATLCIRVLADAIPLPCAHLMQRTTVFVLSETRDRLCAENSSQALYVKCVIGSAICWS